MTLTIIGYHFIRESRHSRYPGIMSLDTDEFRKQVRYLKSKYKILNGDELLDSARSGTLNDLQSSALLVFDDGYLDHFTQAFPVLCNENVAGCFFPIPKCIQEDFVMDANKIHFVLASVENRQAIIDHIFKALQEHRTRHELPDDDFYWKEYSVPNRWDTREVIFIKRILQRGLPEELSRSIINTLFSKYVTSDEASFSRELYMNAEQISCMRKNGMYFGCHGYSHSWLGKLEPARQKKEIDLSLMFLRNIGIPTDAWMISYPFGSYDDSLLSLLHNENCQVGITLKVGTADLKEDDLLTLPRLDANDLVKVMDQAD